MENTALTVVQRAAAALQSDVAAIKLTELVASTQSITTITSADGRAECHAAAMKAKAARVDIEKVGKAARDDATAFSKAVIAEQARLVSIIEPEQVRLINIRDIWDEKIEKEKEAKRKKEEEKIAAIIKKIDAIKNITTDVAGTSSAIISNALDFAKAIAIDESFGVYLGVAKEAQCDVISRLSIMLDATIKKEKDAAIEAEQRRIHAEIVAKELALAQEEARLIKEANARIKAENDRVWAENLELAKALKAEQDALKAKAEADRRLCGQEAAEKAVCERHAAEQIKHDQATVSNNGASSTQGTSSVTFSPAEAAAYQPPPSIGAPTPTAEDSVMQNLYSEIYTSLDSMTKIELEQVAHFISRIIERRAA